MKLSFHNLVLNFFVTIMVAGGCNAQFYNNGSQVTVTNGTQLIIKSGSLINNDSSIYNAGTITVEGDCFISNKASSRIISFGTDSLIVYNNFNDGSLYGQNSGVLVLKGGNQNLTTTSQILANLSVSGSGLKTISGSAIVRFKLDLQNGHIVVPSSNTFGIDSTGLISQKLPGTQSFIIGALFRKKNNGVDSLFYPIGNSINEYRPAILAGIATPIGKNPTFEVNTQLANPTSGSGISTIYNRVWTVVSNIPNYQVDNLKLAYSETEVGLTPLENLVVAQGSSIGSKYNSIGNISLDPGIVSSEFRPTQNFYAIGTSSNLKGNFKVFLEGPYNGVDMDNNLLTNTALSDSLLPSIGMLPGYQIPPGAVDRMAFILSTGPLNIDTAYSWLIKDGSIKDYATGTKNYVTFTKAIPGNNYYVIADHRNHLPASSASIKLTAVSTKGSYNYDYTSGVYGGGALLNMTTGDWLLYASDAYKSAKNQTDVFDVLGVGRDEVKYVGKGNKFYRSTDLNLDGTFNSKDYQISADHNSKLYYSTLP